MSFKNTVDEFLASLGQGDILGTFEKYYAEDVIMQENNEAPRVGKATNREYEKNFVSSIQEYRGGGVDFVTYNEEKQVAMIQSWMDVTLKGDYVLKNTQVSVQQWKDGKITHERFFYSR